MITIHLSTPTGLSSGTNKHIELWYNLSLALLKSEVRHVQATSKQATHNSDDWRHLRNSAMSTYTHTSFRTLFWDHNIGNDIQFTSTKFTFVLLNYFPSEIMG